MNQSYLQSHYEIQECDYGYSFITKNGEEYLVTFLDYPLFQYSGLQELKVYCFNIERNKKSDRKTRVVDFDLERTIAYILSLFFEKHNQAIITQCETLDGNSGSRERLFSRWYRKYGEGAISRKSGLVRVDDSTSTTYSIYYKESSVESELFVEIFQDLLNENFYL